MVIQVSTRKQNIFGMVNLTYKEVMVKFNKVGRKKEHKCKEAVVEYVTDNYKLVYNNEEKLIYLFEYQKSKEAYTEFYKYCIVTDTYTYTTEKLSEGVEIMREFARWVQKKDRRDK